MCGAPIFSRVLRFAAVNDSVCFSVSALDSYRQHFANIALVIADIGLGSVSVSVDLEMCELMNAASAGVAFEGVI